MAEQNDISDLSAAHKWLLIAALSAGVGNGVLGLNKDTSDRYKGTQARADFHLRDAKIEALEKQQAIHLQHSAAYTQIVNRIARDLRELEQELKTRGRAK